LLSLIATALRCLDFDVLSAQVYTRAVSVGVSEAVDLFWIRRRGAIEIDREIISDSEITRLEQLIEDLLKNEERAGALVERALVQSSNSSTGQTSVFFEADQAGKAVLAVQTPDRPGLLLTISRTLFRQDAQVLHSEVKTEGGRALDRFHLVDSDGKGLTPARRTTIARAVQSAIEDLDRKAG
jgi:UTP:GlnB (protein PII) uridylyltransferase